MVSSRPDRPYLISWLRRMRKQLAPSGRLSEVALILSQRQGHTAEYWSRWLRSILDGKLSPTLDELTEVESILSRPKPREKAAVQELLF